MSPSRPALSRPTASRRARRLAAALLASAAGLVSVPHAAQAVAPAAVPVPVLAPVARHAQVPTAAARAAGVQPGNAPMGWRSALAPVTRSLGRTGPTTAATRPFVPSGVLGIDISSYQGRLSWSKQVKAGKQFAYVKATEGTSYRNPYFASQYGGAYAAGMIRGAYHFASPSGSSGRAQAAYFVRNGGAWVPDGKTLPGVLDIEYNPYGATCYGLSKAKMVAWVNSFVVEYKRETSRDAVIYTTTDWWKRCTGNSTKFATTNPLWLARYGTKTPGTLPGGWQWATFWQYTSSPIDQDRFSSPKSRLVVLATNAR